MDDDDEIQVVEVRVFRPSLTVIVSSYISVELWWRVKQPCKVKLTISGRSIGR